MPFDVFNRAVHALPATRAGFEGLVGGLLAKATGDRIRLLSSGEQGGIDGVTDPTAKTPRRVVQAKRYKTTSHLAIGSLRVEMDRAVQNFSALETWILATTKPLRGREVEELRKHGETLGVGVVVLDWDASADALPVLGVLAAAYPEVTELFLPRARTKVWRDIADLSGHGGFASTLGRIKHGLAAAGLGFGNARSVATRRLEAVFSDAAAARALAGPSPRFMAEAPPVARIDLLSTVEHWRSHGQGAAVLLGREGVGKTWSALGALRAGAVGDDPALPIIVSAERARQSTDGVASIIALLSEMAAAEGMRLDDARTFWRRRLGLWAEAAGLTEPPRIMVVVDGLDEAPDLDWGFWLASLVEARWKSLFQVLVTCREETWTHSLAGQLAGPSTYQVIPVGVFKPEERDAYLRDRGLDVSDLSVETAEVALHPRTAFHLTRLAGALPDAKRITREQLLLADFHHLSLIKGGGFTAVQFESLVKGLAETAREAARDNRAVSLSEGEIAHRARDVSIAAERELPRILNDLVSGSWCRRAPNDPTRITFEDDLLPAAVGMALADRLRQSDGNAVDEIAAFLEPWSADDLTERMLRMTAAALVVDPATQEPLVRTVLALWRRRPLRTTAAEDAWRRLHPFRPDLFLDLCKEGGGDPSDWMCEWGVAHLWKDFPEHRDLVERHLFRWLAHQPLAPELSHQDQSYERFLNRGRRRQERTVRALAARGFPQWAELIGGEESEGRDPAFIALRVIAMGPLTPFIPGLAAWAVTGAMTGRFSHAAAVSTVVRYNAVDGIEGEAALASAAAAMVAMGGRRARHAAAQLLEATGQSEDARLARQLRPLRYIRQADDGLRLHRDRLSAIAPLPARPSWVLHRLAQYAVNPDVRLAAPLQHSLDRALGSLEASEVAAGLIGRQPDLAAARRWSTAAFVRKAADAALVVAREEGQYGHAVELLGALSEEDLAALRGSPPPPEGHGASSLWVSVNIARRTFAQQRDFLLGTGDRAWSEKFDALLNRPKGGQYEKLLASIDFKRPWSETWRSVTLAIGAQEAFSLRVSEPNLDWRAAFDQAEPYAVKQALRLASRLKSVSAAKELLRRGWATEHGADQGARFLGSDIHRTLDDAHLSPRLATLEPDVWFQLYLDRPSLRSVLTPLIRRWIEAELSHTGGRSFGGEHWSYPDEQDGYAAFCNDAPNWAAGVLKRTWEDPSHRRNIVWDYGDGPGWRLLRALAPHDPSLVAELWTSAVTESRGVRSSNVDHLPSELPAGAVFDALRLTMIDRASTDEELFDTVVSLERHGHLPWLEDVIRAGLASPRAVHRARAITIAGFLSGAPESKIWDEVSSADPGPGWLAAVHAEAELWRNRAIRMRYWASILLFVEDDLTAWSANGLFMSIADERYLGWWGKPPFVRRISDWRSQWINLDGGTRRRQRREAGKNLRKTRLHTPGESLGLPLDWPPSFR